MSKFKFPRNPGVERENPFEDDRGKNPFGDDAKPTPQKDDGADSSDENPYASEEQEAAQPYRPDDYETFLPHRGRLVFWLGAIGFGIQLVTIGVAVVAILGMGGFLDGIVYSLPGQLLGLAVSVPAWAIGHNDFAAIEAGAMKSEGRKATRAGLRLGITGTLLGSLQLLIFIGLLIHNAYA